MKTIIDAFTSVDSPYAVSETPVSIVLITPGPPYLPQMELDRQPGRSLDRTREFRDTVNELYTHYKQLEKDQTGQSGWGWKIALLDFWACLEAEAGGLSDELAPFYL